MDKLISKSIHSLFSEKDIQAVLPNIPIYTYEELKNKTINDLLPASIILYQDTKNMGHWTAVFLDRNRKINFFDSYGYPPDYQLAFSRYNRLYDQKYLSNIIKDHNIIYNDIRLQKKISSNTCGRWVVMRLLMKELTSREFSKLFIKQKFPPDWYICCLTLFAK